METHLCLTSTQWEPFLKYPGEPNYSSYNYRHYQGNEPVNRGLFPCSRSIVFNAWVRGFFVYHHVRPCATRQMPEGAICQVYIPVTAPCHSTGHRHWTHRRRCHTRQENAKFQHARGLGCCAAAQTDHRCSLVMLRDKFIWCYWWCYWC